MAKKLYLHIKWDETKEKNNKKAGDEGVYDAPVCEGAEIKLLGIGKSATVIKVTDDEVTLSVPEKGEYRVDLGESTRIAYSRGYQVAGDWVDECLSYEIKLSDMTLWEYEKSLPDFEIENGVLKKSRATGDVVTVPYGVTEIGHAAFSQKYHKEIILPPTVKVIGSCAFDGCKYLTKINLPEGLKEIKSFALAWTAIEELEIPKSLELTSCYAFSGTPLLEKIKNDKFVIIGGRFLCMYNGDEDVAEVPNGVTCICAGAFNNRKNDRAYFYTPKKIVLPESVKNIDESAFRYLYGLKEINLREDMEIHERAFLQSSYEEEFRKFLEAKGKAI